MYTPKFELEGFSILPPSRKENRASRFLEALVVANWNYIMKVGNVREIPFLGPFRPQTHTYSRCDLWVLTHGGDSGYAGARGSQGTVLESGRASPCWVRRRVSSHQAALCIPIPTASTCRTSCRLQVRIHEDIEVPVLQSLECRVTSPTNTFGHERKEAEISMASTLVDGARDRRRRCGRLRALPHVEAWSWQRKVVILRLRRGTWATETSVTSAMPRPWRVLHGARRGWGACAITSRSSGPDMSQQGGGDGGEFGQSPQPYQRPPFIFIRPWFRAAYSGRQIRKAPMEPVLLAILGAVGYYAYEKNEKTQRGRHLQAFLRTHMKSQSRSRRS